MNDYYCIIAGYNAAYRISKRGEVQSAWTRRGRKCLISDSWRSLQPIQRHGYLTINLTKGGGQKQNRSVHRLVLEAFVGPCPDGLVACHNDGDPRNNDLSNLRWDTPLANSDDKLLHGTMCRGEAARHAKLREHEVLDIRRLGAEGHSTSSLAERFQVSVRNIRAIISGRSWRHLLPVDEIVAPVRRDLGPRGAAA